ncbi:MAG: hypothetical protein DVB23_001065 [Verrucomicrobia bacterium]|nr:MAG: hypothetical protein DVB23_001065 [Verrucomicrobiota bacterium]
MTQKTTNVKTKMELWLIFSLLTVLCWGTYGIALHGGAVGMQDPANGRYKAFLIVGLMYFLVAVLAPAATLLANGQSLNVFSYPKGALAWASVAGILGAIGAFGVLLAFGAKGNPAVVMSIVFAGAPVINAIVSLLMHPPKSAIHPMFFVGILCAAVGGCLVTFFKPGAPPPKKGGSPAPIEQKAH